MWAVDTNLLVRYYTRDDEKQSLRALTWLQAQAPCFVPVTVVQELYWVLASAYDMPRAKVLKVIAHLNGSPAFAVESSAEVHRALQAATRGLDFADALHWALSHGCEGVVTFDDRGFARKAKKLGLKPVVALPG